MNCLFRWPCGAVLLSVACTLAQAAEPVSGDGISAAPQRSVWERLTDFNAWQGPGNWRALVSPYTQHYSYDRRHKPVWAIGLERQDDDDWLAGASYFSNSFGQPSGYVYIGHRNEHLLEIQPLFFQWSAGLLYGYRGQFKDKVPFNHNGFSPGALVTLGWQFTPAASVAVHALGDAGLMVQLAYDIH